MTYRDLLNIEIKKSNNIFYITFPIFFIFNALVNIIRERIGEDLALVLSCTSAVVFVIIAIRNSFRIRCPSCSASLLGKIGRSSVFSLSDDIKFCHNCGISFDSEIDISITPNNSQERTE